MFSPHGAMSVMRHWEFTLVLDNSGASVGMSLGQSGTENKMQNNHLSYTFQRTLGGRFRLWLNQFFMNCILPPLKDSVFRTHQHWNIYFELKRGHSNFLSVSGIYTMGGGRLWCLKYTSSVVGENWPIFCSYSTNYYMAKHNNSHTIVTLDNS